MDTHFCKGDLWITEAALWEEARFKGLVSLSLPLLAPLKARGSEVAWRNPEGLKLRFRSLAANAVGHTSLSAQNPPVGRPCQPHERGMLAALAPMLAHLQAAVSLFFMALSRRAGRIKGPR